MSNQPDERHIFVHMPKSGGGTVAGLLRAMPEVESLPGGRVRRQPGADRKLIVQGHLAFGHHALAGVKPLYCTILREPADRLVSHFFYSARQLDGLDLPAEARMASFLRWLESLNQANYYCRLLSRYAYVIGADLGLAAAGASSPYDTLIRMRERRDLVLSPALFAGADPEADLGAARENLNQMFFFAGVYESFEATLQRLFADLGLDAPAVARQRAHVTLDRPLLTDLPGGVRDRIEALTRYDRVLYDEVARRFETRAT